MRALAIGTIRTDEGVTMDRNEDLWSIALTLHNKTYAGTSVVVAVEHSHSNLYYATASTLEGEVIKHHTVLMRNGKVELQN
ncbi:Hypothetical Protein OBI_RACECAR_36 [Arthrobacter phage Racecar]|nr:hypothetical protein PBI_RACECAR_117 [Arthrobacter phage Racecar]QFG12792.1 hypothetical protein PBI_MIMI_114 [Arthrobacter phage Mimi]